jgi:phospholipid/cholesterol/gamma-HCH transport system substrate-binding protein
MPRTRSLAWSELKIGIVSIVALAIAATLIFMLSGEGGFSWQRYALKTVFTNIAGLKVGAPVRIAGVEVGAVTDVAFVGDKVEVTYEVVKEQQQRITTVSTAVLGSVSLLGESAVDITPSSQGSPVPEWSYVPAGKAPAAIADVATQAVTGIEQVTALIQEVRGGRGTVGKLFTDEQLYRDLNGLVAAAAEVASGISAGRGTLGRLATNPAAARSLEASMANLEMMTARIRAGEGSIGKLLNDDALSRSLTSTGTNLEAITGRLNRGEGTAGKLMTDQALYDNLKSTTDRLDKVIALLQQSQGTAGALLNDKALYDNLNGTVSEMRNLVSDIRRDPKKYLNVRVSLF